MRSRRSDNWYRGLVGLVIVSASMMLAGTAGAQPSLLNELTERGIVVTDQKTVVLPVPLSIGQDATGDASESQKTIAGRFGWDRFTKPTVVAPVWLDVDAIKDADGAKLGHLVHFRFVIHRSLSDLGNRDLMSSIFGRGDSKEDAKESDFKELSADDLTDTGSTDFVALETRSYAFLKTPLMNRVLLQGVIEGETTDAAGVHVLAWRLVDTIPTARKYGSTWRSISKNNRGESVVGPAQGYRGCGGYLAIQSLGGLDDQLNKACLVEARLVIHEPSKWFGGSNYLRSKFSILIQEAVRKFRRELGPG